MKRKELSKILQELGNTGHLDCTEYQGSDFEVLFKKTNMETEPRYSVEELVKILLHLEKKGICESDEYGDLSYGCALDWIKDNPEKVKKILKGD